MCYNNQCVINNKKLKYKQLNIQMFFNHELSDNYKILPFELKYQIINDVYKGNTRLLLDAINKKENWVFHKFDVFPIMSNVVGLQLWELAIKTNDIKLVNKLYKNYVIRPLDIQSIAIKYGNMNTILRIHELFKITCHNISSAVLSGCIDKVIWVHKNTEGTSWRDILLDAVEGGNLEVVKYVYYNKIGTSSAFNAISIAANKGNLEIVKWLHLINPKHCSDGAFDLAASNGHIDVVKFVLENRKEKFTIDAINKVSEKGYTNIMKLLLPRWGDTRINSVIKIAVENGHLEMVKLLYNYNMKQNNGFSTLYIPIMNAIKTGQLEIIKWICSISDPIAIRDEIINSATRYRQFHILEWYVNTFKSDNTTLKK